MKIHVVPYREYTVCVQCESQSINALRYLSQQLTKLMHKIFVLQ